MTDRRFISHREQAGCSAAAVDVVIGLGSNLGDRMGYLREAVGLLSAQVVVLASSHVYETVPVGGPSQGAFLNAAVRVLAEGTPHGLLDTVLDVERKLGRERSERWGPRTIDLDLLWSPDARARSSRLTLPHPRLLERAFALVPLLDVAPDALCPESGVTYASRLSSLSHQGISLTSYRLPCRWTASDEGGTSRAVAEPKIFPPR